MDNNQNTHESLQQNALKLQASSDNKNKYNLAHTAFAIISVLVGILYYLFVFDTIVPGEKTYKICIFTFVFCIYLWAYFFFQHKYINSQTIFLMSAALLFSLHFVFVKNGGIIQLFALFCIHICALLSAFSVSENNNSTLLDNIVSGTIKAICSPYSKFFSLFGSFSALKGEKSDKLSVWGKKNSQNIGLVIIGVIMSLPVLITVTCLLLSDAFFNSFASEISEKLGSMEFDINISPFSVTVSILCALMLFGALYAADTEQPKTRTNSGNCPSVICSTAMICFSAVYILFIIAQIDGFTCMALGNLPENTTYAQFARSGFFELCTVACINGILLYIVSNNCIENEKGRLFRTMRYLICFFTIAIVAVAASKMIFYIDAYGFTQKRFCTLWFMLLLAILFSFAIKFFRNSSFRISRISTYITVLMLLVLFYVDWESLAVCLNKSLGY